MQGLTKNNIFELMTCQKFTFAVIIMHCEVSTIDVVTMNVVVLCDVIIATISLTDPQMRNSGRLLI
jgi:hypothetical protein